MCVFKFLLTLCGLLLNFHDTLQQAVVNSEPEILAEFYKLTSLSSKWTNSSGWLGTLNHCFWHGVSCQNGKVSGLILSHNNLSGSIPSVIFQLESLTNLDLSGNSLFGNVDVELNRAKKLRVLNLGWNRLNGFMSSSLSSLTSLTYLGVHENDIQVLPDLDQSQKLLFALLIYNNPLKWIPESWTNLSQITFFDCSFNPLISLTPNIWKWKALSTLRISGVRVGDGFFDQDLPPQLIELRLKDCGLTRFPNNILKLKHMLFLYLDGNQINEIPDQVNQLPLVSLSCSFCGLNKYPVLHSMPSLQVLNLLFNTQSEEIHLEGEFPNLHTLQISAKTIVSGSLNRIVGLTYVWLKGLVEIPPLPQSLVFFFIDSYMGSGWSHLENQTFPNLIDFRILSQQVEAWFPSFILKNAPNLTKLQLQGNLTGTLPSQLSNTHLTSFTLANTQIEGTLPIEFGNQKGLAQTLQTLGLIGNPKLTGTIPEELTLIRTLVNLTIQDNNFESKLNENLTRISSKMNICSLRNIEPFTCVKENFELSEGSVCNVRCTGNVLDGVWMNEDHECKSVNPNNATTGIQTMLSQWRKMKLEIKGPLFTHVEQRYSSVDCNSQEITVVRTGTWDIEVLPKQEASSPLAMIFKFSVDSISLFSSNATTESIIWFLCGIQGIQTAFVDVSTSACSNLFPDVQQCPIHSTTATIGFDTSTLWIGRSDLFGWDTCSFQPSTPDSSPSGVELRRNWECSSATELDVCVPVCGDGVVLASEQCDDGNQRAGDGCTNCEREVGWTCEWTQEVNSTNCQVICGDGLVVSPTDCDSLKSNSSKNLFLWFLSLMLVVPTIALGINLWIQKRKAEELVIPSSELTLDQVLGEGHFGKVYRAIWRRNTVVAIKFLKYEEQLAKQLIDDFTKEAQLLVRLPPHPNIVQFLGICFGVLSLCDDKKDATLHDERSCSIETKNSARPKPKELGIVTEFLSAGSLSDHLAQNFSCNSEKTIAEGIEDSMLVDLAKGISAGMDHLHHNSIVHRDLAARNILIQLSLKNDEGSASKSDFGSIRSKPKSEPRDRVGRMLPKISDFGLAGNHKVAKVPVRWSAPEVLIDPQLGNEKSDVWSFGVVLFEICVACHFLPYSSLMNNKEVREFVIRGGQLFVPDGLRPALQALIRACLGFNAPLRPSFSAIHQQLEDLEKGEKQTSQEVCAEGNQENENGVQNEIMIYETPEIHPSSVAPEVPNVSIYYTC